MEKKSRPKRPLSSLFASSYRPNPLQEDVTPRYVSRPRITSRPEEDVVPQLTQRSQTQPVIESKFVPSIRSSSSTQPVLSSWLCNLLTSDCWETRDYVPLNVRSWDTKGQCEDQCHGLTDDLLRKVLEYLKISEIPHGTTKSLQQITSTVKPELKLAALPLDKDYKLENAINILGSSIKDVLESDADVIKQRYLITKALSVHNDSFLLWLLKRLTPNNRTKKSLSIVSELFADKKNKLTWDDSIRLWQWGDAKQNVTPQSEILQSYFTPAGQPLLSLIRAIILRNDVWLARAVSRRIADTLDLRGEIDVPKDFEANHALKILIQANPRVFMHLHVSATKKLDLVEDLLEKYPDMNWVPLLSRLFELVTFVPPVPDWSTDEDIAETKEEGEKLMEQYLDIFDLLKPKDKVRLVNTLKPLDYYFSTHAKKLLQSLEENIEEDK